LAANNSNTLSPTCRPCTVPVNEPLVPSGCRADVTLSPFIRSAVRRMSAVDGPAILMRSESPVVTNVAVGVFRLRIE
jgi:hypothetical protein